MCQGTSDDSAACLDLADRYALGRGTARSVAKRIELRGEACTPPTSWEVCKVVAEYEARRPELADAAVTIHASFCEAKINEACYLGARAAEAAKSWCTGPWDGVRALRDAYGALCKAKVSDACKREASMCTLAQREFLEPRPTCGGGGVGDGTFQPTAEYTALIELCPKDTWSKDVQREMAKLEAYRKSLEAAPR